MLLSKKNYKRIVIKIGSSLFYPTGDNFDFSLISDITEQVARLVEKGKEIVLVSSGAIATGMYLLGFRDRPKELDYLQSMSAIGQNEMMNSYRLFLEKKKLKCAQILLTGEDLNDRKRYLNAKNTILRLLKFGNVVPIINENDTVSTDEIKFGDNDQLSALVASLICADLLIILSDVDGLLDKDKNRVALIPEITAAIKTLASPTKRKTSVGGMITKIKAAKIAVDSGVPCVIANGRHKDIIALVTRQPGEHGTLFLPKKALAERERWIAFGTRPKGKVVVDEGAKKALMNKKSLLCVGVIGTENIFESGDIVSVVDKQGNEFARGKVGISGKKLEEIKGKRFDKEIIHRDNIVIL